MESGKRSSFQGIVIILLGFLAFYAIGFTYKQLAFSYIGIKVGYWIEWCIRYAVIYVIGVPFFILITSKISAAELSDSRQIGCNRFLKYLVITIGLTNLGGILGKLLLMMTTGASITAPSPYFTDGSTLGAFLFLAIVPPVAEELFFRKILLQKLSVQGSGIAVFGSALLFFIYHTLITSFEPHVFMIGLILAYVMLRTNNIVYPILIHSIINLWSVWSTRIAQSLPIPLLLINSLVTLAIPICFIVVLIKNRIKISSIVKKLFKNQTIELIA